VPHLAQQGAGGQVGRGLCHVAEVAPGRPRQICHHESVRCQMPATGRSGMIEPCPGGRGSTSVSGTGEWDTSPILRSCRSGHPTDALVVGSQCSGDRFPGASALRLSVERR